MSLNGILKRLLSLFGSKSKCRELKRSEQYQTRYREWLEQEYFAVFLTASYQAYHYSKAGLKESDRITLIKEENREGIILNEPTINSVHFSYLLDYLKDRTEMLGYCLRSAHSLSQNHGDLKQITETYYLTPKPQDVPGTGHCNQLYGNIILDFIRINGTPGYIRIMRNSIADPHFSAPLPFPELLKALFQSTEIL
ncbi:hypothetical protein [Pontibacter burrus]|uniref:Uncharacterized protein n=1 Tax=Pontibacter burrus TaxID=2704466 RepID=A0A6B3LV77_9BACT|nr:hypothetical protein [Pontibacter burrus]NEM97828.1 hypothetical protein [Pontibacter burrus]